EASRARSSMRDGVKCVSTSLSVSTSAGTARNAWMTAAGSSPIAAGIPRRGRPSGAGLAGGRTEPGGAEITSKPLLDNAVVIATPLEGSAEMMFQLGGGVEHRRADAWDLADRVQQTVVVNQAVVTRAGDIDSGAIELARIGFPSSRRTSISA